MSQTKLKPMKIVTLTMNPSLDISTDVDRVAVNRKLRCGPPSHEPGGGGINVSAAMLELGCSSIAVFPCGGPHGQLMHQLLMERDIQHIPIAIREWTRCSFAVSDLSSGEQYRFSLTGPELNTAEAAACLDALRSMDPAPDIIAASGSLPPGVTPSFMHDLADLAHRINARLVVDTSGESLKQAAQVGVYLLKPNMHEFRELLADDEQRWNKGHMLDLDTEAGQEGGLRRLVEQGACEIAVLSLGAAGVLVATAEGHERLRAPTVPIVSRIGAGDSTVAGILTGLARGYTRRDALMLGVASGSAAVMTPGTQLCRRADVERLFRHMSTQ